MVDTQEFIGPPRTSLDYEEEFGFRSKPKIFDTLDKLKIHIDPQRVNWYFIDTFELASRVLTGEGYFSPGELEVAFTERKDPKNINPNGSIESESFDKFLNSWTHYLLKGDHLVGTDKLKEFARYGKIHAKNTIKELSKKEKINISELSELSSASLFISLTEGNRPKKRDDLIILKKHLKHAVLNELKEPNSNNDEDQISIIESISNYFLAKATSISFSDDGKLALTF